MNISMAEMLTALQQGTVDGQENPYSVIQARKIYEFQKYLTEWSYNMDPFFYTVHEDVWKTFPEDIQKVILASAEEAAAYGLVLALKNEDFAEAAERLAATRPTAVNLFWAIKRMRELWLENRNNDYCMRAGRIVMLVVLAGEIRYERSGMRDILRF